MNGILGTFQLLMDDNTEQDNKQLIKQGLESSKSLVLLLNDNLDLSKIEEGKLTLELNPFDANGVVENVYGTMLPVAQAKHVELSMTLLDKNSCHWIGDESRFRQIIFNLVSNAIKFTEQGSVTLKLALSENGELLVQVTDTGIGMSSADKKTLFKRFEQSDGSITRRFGGSGLGMAISHHLASLMNGHFTVDSELHQSTSISLSLPLHQSKTTTKTKPIADVTMTDIHGVTLLLAE